VEKAFSSEPEPDLHNCTTHTTAVGNRIRLCRLSVPLRGLVCIPMCLRVYLLTSSVYKQSAQTNICANRNYDASSGDVRIVALEEVTASGTHTLL
jgi:hypothetical protein